MKGNDKAARAARKRKVKVRLGWPTVPYSLRWDDLDCVSGEGGHGLSNMLKTWWQVRRGTWEDDWLALDYDSDPDE